MIAQDCVETLRQRFNKRECMGVSSRSEDFARRGIQLSVSNVGRNGGIKVDVLADQGDLVSPPGQTTP